MTDAELAEARLSAWRDAERENTELHGEIARLRAQMKQLGADMAELARVRAALNAEALDLVPAFRMMQAIAEERAAVVAWLQELSASSLNRDPVEELQYAARSIERGEHREEEER